MVRITHVVLVPTFQSVKSGGDGIEVDVAADGPSLWLRCSSALVSAVIDVGKVRRH